MKENPKKPTSKRKEPTKKTYHHGNLSEALLESAESMIRKDGFESFSLRACAKQAGVAHSAPGHYFKDVSEFLTEVAARAYEKLASRLKYQKTLNQNEDPIYSVLLEYVRFALDEPKIFYMIFHSDRIDRSTTRFQVSGDSALKELVLSIDPDISKRKQNNEKILFAWSFIHGIAMLSIDGPMSPVGGKRKGLELEQVEISVRRLVKVIRNW
ncbi:TetR/AcrR family transcriptional regulator [Leptospira yanagawae]|uniref:TetR/AcrR family transcriptional regulator n=1 Tax=Leptospira yanagawae TaxID=293069 RepID=A0ABY2LZQ3_9LEPT|nr:TetR/AcrR family transcriptional regulator [Leptospira yanagawae]TGL19236.1 TetR/AcrR family transcriptional regulator [Leptospira yanagawae]